MHKLIIVVGAALLMASTANARDSHLAYAPEITRVEILEIPLTCVPDENKMNGQKFRGSRLIFYADVLFGGAMRSCTTPDKVLYALEKGTFKVDEGYVHTLSEEHREQLGLYLMLLSQRDHRPKCESKTAYIITAFSYGNYVSQHQVLDDACFSTRRSVRDSGSLTVKFISPSALARIYEGPLKTPDHFE